MQPAPELLPLASRVIPRRRDLILDSAEFTRFPEMNEIFRLFELADLHRACILLLRDRAAAVASSLPSWNEPKTLSHGISAVP